MSESRIFRTSDPDFPTTKVLQDRLRRAGRVEGVPVAVLRPPATPVKVASTDALPDYAHVVLGGSDDGQVYLGLDRLMAGRLLIQGSSGAGKSTALRRIIEGAHSHVTVMIIDPEGEFGNLAAHIGATTITAGETAGDGLAAAALAAREHRVSLHIDLTDVEPDIRIQKAAAFLGALLASPREFWSNSLLVAIDEAHLLAPQLAASARDAETRRLGVATLTDLCSRGRKRGIGTIIATQRLAKLAGSVISELHNCLLGLNVFDRDVARGADLLGMTYDKAAVMRDLSPGEFFAIGPALSSFPKRFRVGETVTQQLGGSPALKPSAGLDDARARELLRLDQFEERAPVPQSVATGKGIRLVDDFLLAPGAADAARVMSALVPIAPNATTSSELTKHLGLDVAAVDAAVDLLASLGAVDVIRREDSQIVRLAARLRLKVRDTKIVGLA